MGPKIASLLAPAICESTSLKCIGLLGNQLDDATATMLLEIKEAKPALLSLCCLAPDQTEAFFRGWGLGPADAKLLAPETAMGSLTSINLSFNDLGTAGAKALVDGGAFRARSGQLPRGALGVGVCVRQ